MDKWGLEGRRNTTSAILQAYPYMTCAQATAVSGRRMPLRNDWSKAPCHPPATEPLLAALRYGEVFPRHDHPPADVQWVDILADVGKGGAGHILSDSNIRLSYQCSGLACNICLFTDHKPALVPPWAIALLWDG